MRTHEALADKYVMMKRPCFDVISKIYECLFEIDVTFCLYAFNVFYQDFVAFKNIENFILCLYKF